MKITRFEVDDFVARVEDNEELKEEIAELLREFYKNTIDDRCVRNCIKLEYSREMNRVLSLKFDSISKNTVDVDTCDVIVRFGELIPLKYEDVLEDVDFTEFFPDADIDDEMTIREKIDVVGEDKVNKLICEWVDDLYDFSIEDETYTTYNELQRIITNLEYYIEIEED